MIGMSEAIMPIVSGMEFPLPLPPLGGEGVVAEREHRFFLPQKEITQWEQFEKCSKSFASVVKSLGDGIEKRQVSDKPNFFKEEEFEKPVVNTLTHKCVQAVDTKEVVAHESPNADETKHAQVKDFEKPIVEAATPQRVQAVDTKEVVAIESPRTVKIEHTQVKDFEKPLVETATPQRVQSVDAKDVVAIESLNADETKHVQVTDFEKPLVSTATPQRVQLVHTKEVVAPESPNAEEIKDNQINIFEKPQVNAAAPQSVQAPESVTVSRLVDAIVEKIAVSSTLMANGEGEIRIQLKSDILDGSSIKIEVKNGELKVVVEPASYIAEQILIKSQETFQNQLAERVTAWRVNVGIAAFDSRSGLRRRLEEQ
jgi:hypothetical protein